ncbi:MAG: MoaD/ThiS family protein [Planctomycetaceae bacterium]|nr:MoaD/ThiS family protein [Planctomycetaceae bacterium]
MRITVEYMAQIKRAAGTAREEVELPGGATLGETLSQLAKQHGDPLAGMLLDADGKPINSLLLFLGEDQVRLEKNPVLQDGAQLTISTPISGG